MAAHQGQRTPKNSAKEEAPKPKGSGASKYREPDADGYIYTPWITRNGVRIPKPGGGMWRFKPRQ